MSVGMRRDMDGWDQGILAEVKHPVETEARAITEEQVSENKPKASGEEMSFSSFQTIRRKKFIE